VFSLQSGEIAQALWLNGFCEAAHQSVTKVPAIKLLAIRMDFYTSLFWFSTLIFLSISAYLVFMCKKRSNIFYIQIASGCGMFATSKIGRKFLGLE
jgi:hypothetical protein